MLKADFLSKLPHLPSPCSLPTAVYRGGGSTQQAKMSEFVKKNTNMSKSILSGKKPYGINLPHWSPSPGLSPMGDSFLPSNKLSTQFIINKNPFGFTTCHQTILQDLRNRRVVSKECFPINALYCKFLVGES